MTNPAMRASNATVSAVVFHQCNCGVYDVYLRGRGQTAATLGRLDRETWLSVDVANGAQRHSWRQDPSRWADRGRRIPGRKPGWNDASPSVHSQPWIAGGSNVQ